MNCRANKETEDSDSRGEKQITRVSLDEKLGIYDDENVKSKLYVEDAPDRGKYPAERRVLQIIEILKLLTDEEHNLSKDELGRLLSLYRIAKYHNGTSLESPNTLTSTIENMLLELDPAIVCFTDILGYDEKKHLVEKLISTSSTYYKTPFWDGEDIKFNPKSVHGRFSSRHPKENVQFIQSLKVIQLICTHLRTVIIKLNAASCVEWRRGRLGKSL